jgi:hypothetical protein
VWIAQYGKFAMMVQSEEEKRQVYGEELSLKTVLLESSVSQADHLHLLLTVLLVATPKKDKEILLLVRHVPKPMLKLRQKDVLLQRREDMLTTQQLALVSDFSRLFRGRTDIWFDSQTNTRGLGNLTTSHWVNHLQGNQPIGTYNLLPNSHVWWSATDIDIDDLDKALAIVDVWLFYGALSFIERSRSKGYHVWLFHPEQVAATTARQAWLWVHEVAKVDATEVYPKQTDGSSTFGNCIRLPYPAHAAPSRQQFFNADSPDELWPVEYFTTLANKAMRTRVKGYSPATSKFMEMVRRRGLPVTATPQNISGIRPEWHRTARGASNQAIYDVYANGAIIPKGQRDTMLWTLVCFVVVGMNTPKKDAEEIIRSIWYKQCEEVDGNFEKKLQEKLRRAERLQLAKHHSI